MEKTEEEPAHGNVKLFSPESLGYKEAFHTLEGDVIENEVIDMCYFIAHFGTHTLEGTYDIKYGDLFRKIFEHHTKISTRLLKILKKGRKMELINFEGEMLYQGQDDHKIISLMGTPPQRINFAECDIDYTEDEESTQETKEAT